MLIVEIALGVFLGSALHTALQALVYVVRSRKEKDQLQELIGSLQDLGNPSGFGFEDDTNDDELDARVADLRARETVGV